MLKCEFKDLSSKPYGVVENSSPSVDQLENVPVLFLRAPSDGETMNFLELLHGRYVHKRRISAHSE